MKKLFIIALFVLGMYNAPVFAMAQEVILSELYSFIPYDNPKDDGRGGGPDPTQIQASINGDQLSIDMGTDAPAYAEVIDPETGEVVVDDWAIIGGGSLVHQFTHIGAHVMIQGGSKINKDVPPYIIAAREPISYCGINSVGLNRRAFTQEQITAIQNVYRLMYLSGLNVSQAVAQIEETLPVSEERDLILEFVKGSPRGIVRGYN